MLSIRKRFGFVCSHILSIISFYFSRWPYIPTIASELDSLQSHVVQNTWLVTVFYEHVTYCTKLWKPLERALIHDSSIDSCYNRWEIRKSKSKIKITIPIVIVIIVSLAQATLNQDGCCLGKSPLGFSCELIPTVTQCLTCGHGIWRTARILSLLIWPTRMNRI